VESGDIIIQILEMDVHRISRVRVAKGVDAGDFNQEEGVMQAEKEIDPRAQEREEIEDIPEDIDDSIEYEAKQEADLVEKVS